MTQTGGDASMRVLHVLAEITRSGAESMLLTAVSEFRAHGFESDVLSTGATPGAMASAFGSAGFGVHHVPFAKSPAFFVRVYRLMRHGNYDVIHLHTERANFWLGLVALAVRPRRSVRTVHSVFGFEGGLRRRRGIQRRILQRLGVTHVACGPTVRRNERERFGLQTMLAPSWYDSSSFFPAVGSERSDTRRALGIADDETVLVTTGGCAPVKNHATLIEALARLPAENRPLYLHVGIEQPDQPERKLAAELGVSERIRFLGPLPDLHELYVACDVFVMPSLYEGFSVAALEGLASGLDALFAYVGGLRDLRDLFPAVWYAEPTVDSVTDALTRLLSDTPDERRSRSAGYAERTRALFGLEIGAQRYIEIYRGAVPADPFPASAGQ